MAPWTKLYLPGTSRCVPVKPALPSAVGAYQAIFMPVGLTNRTEVRLVGKRGGIPAGRAPTAATAPGGGMPGFTGGARPGAPGTPGGPTIPFGAIIPGG